MHEKYVKNVNLIPVVRKFPLGSIQNSREISIHTQVGYFQSICMYNAKVNGHKVYRLM